MKKLFLALVGASFFLTSYAQCSLIEVSLQQRANAASLTIEGRVVSVNSFWNTNHTMIYTSNIIEVYKIFKGSVSTSTIEILTEGGTVGLDRISLEPNLVLNPEETGIFTCGPVNRAHHIAQSRSGIPRFETFAVVQGFIKYNLDGPTASDPFKTYSNIENEVYAVVLDPQMRNYRTVKAFDINGSTQRNGPSQQLAIPSITSFSPITLTAGTGTVLTINGTDFGATQGSGSVGFKNADDGGGTYINPLQTQILSWSNTQITVEVPSGAGSGTIQVTQAGTGTSGTNLTISYNHMNVTYNPGSGNKDYQTDHINDNTAGGYTWNMNTAFDAATTERASFMRAFDTWKCGTGVNWVIGATTAINDALSDGTNCICNDNTAPLSAGILGVCYSYWSGCASGPTIVWYVSELDIIFDEGSNVAAIGCTWQYGPAAPSVTQYDFETVAVHELGHGHQLGHVILGGAIMHYAISNGASNRSLGVNDLAGGNFVQAKSEVANVCGPGAMTHFSCAVAPVADFSGTPTALCAGGTVSYTDLSTNTPTSWSWVFQGGTPATSTSQNPTITYNTAGTYSVTLTATNASGSDAQSYAGYITVYQNPTASALSQTNISCNGGANGAASVSVSGGTPAYTYNWTPGNPTGDGTVSVSGLTAGTWTCTVSDSHTCTSSQTFNITQPSAISLTAASQTNISCNGGANGAASVNTATGGAGGYSYNWTPGNPTGDGTVSVTGLTSGTWTCTVTDANSCTTTRTFSITQPSALVASALSQTNISCNGGANGAASVSVSGGTTAYSYNWTPGNPTGDGTTSVTGLTFGTWTCTVTDANSCTTTQTFNITQPSAISLTAASQTNISCNGGANGAASVNAASGGAGGYSYNWTPGNPTGDGTVSVTGLSVGTWTCTVTDANSCTTTQTFNITQPSAISLTAASQTNISCNGGANGAASVNTATGGAGGYTYNWTPGNPTGDGTVSVTGLTAGTWTCTVTDANSCTTTRTFNITQPSALVASALSQTNISCNGGSNGAASVSVSGGTTTYSYNWTPGNPTGDGTTSVTGLTFGTWTCTVTDANSCTTTQTFNITQPSVISLTAASQTNISCNGGANGAASVNTATGGAGGYTYNWTPGNPTGDGTVSVTGLTVGTWTCTVTDANSCTTTQTFNITQPSVITSSISSTPTACSGNTGTATVSSVAGGAGGYSYSWAPSGGTATTASNLTSGNYTCTITDANTCSITKTVTVGNTGGPSLTAASQTNISCNSGANGAASVNAATGGVGPYTYDWTPGNPTGDGTISVTGLTFGTWTCTVTDANLCAATQTFNITQPTSLVASPLAQSNISCFGGSNGTASVTVSGGTTTYSYNWTPGNPTGDGTTSVTGLTFGTWTCTVTDANSCTTTQTFSITQPSAISLTAASQTNISCNGGSNGAASVVAASGGNPSYTYNWTPGNPTGDGTTSVTGLTSGTWTCTVTDANSCTTTQTFSITQPSAITISPASQTNISCNGGSNGAATVVAASGGTPSYTYNWTPGNPTGDGTTSVTGLTSGTWTCTVTDANSCTTTQTFSITQPSALSLSISSTNESCIGSCDGTTSMVASGGAGSYTYSWSPSGGSAANATSLCVGTYTCLVTDGNGCTGNASVSVGSNSCGSAPIANFSGTPTSFCVGGTVNFSDLSSNTPTSWAWTFTGGTPSSSTSQNPSIVYNTPGTYAVSLTATNAFGSGPLTMNGYITVNSNPSATAVVTNVSCNGSGNGAINLTPAGGTGPYTFAWTPSGQTTEDRSSLTPATYSVTVTDANGCINLTSYVVTQPALIAATTSSVNESCAGNCDGTATIVASGGTAPYTYSWSPSGGTAATATSRCAGNYTCTVTDANGCTRTGSVTVGSNSCAGTTQLVQNYTNQLMSNWIYVTAVSGATNYEYQFSIGATVVSTVQRGSGSTYLPLAWAAIGYNNTYNVKVRAYVGSTWGSFGAIRTVAMQSTIPLTQLNATSCGATNLTLGSNINVIGVTGATNYEYKFTDLSTSAVYNYVRGSNSMYVTLVWVSTLDYGHSYSVAVRSFVGGVWSAYGPLCNITLQSTVPLTSLAAASCGVSLPGLSSVVNCVYVYGASDYQYQFTDLSTSLVTYWLRGNSSTNLTLSWVSPALLANHSYSVLVRSKVHGVWTTFGSPCTISIGGARLSNPVLEEQQIAVEGVAFSASLYPNPIVAHSAITLNINGADGKTAVVKIMDLAGKEIVGYQLQVEGETFLKTFEETVSLPAGLYFMSVTVNDKVQNLKFVVE